MQYGERFNTITHLIGTCLAILGAIIVLSLALSKNNIVEIIAVTIYAVTTVALYSASTLYHGSKGTIKNLLRRLDYIGIYLKIAGNQTPFLILLLRGNIGWVTLSIIWTLAIIGIAHEVSSGPQTRRYSLIIYCIMTFSIVPVLKNLVDALPPQGFALIMAGYVSYAIGFYFFLNDERIKHGHGIWHLGVIGGTTLQYLCLVMYVV